MKLKIDIRKMLFKVESYASMYVADLDFASIYPTLMRVLNISRSTMRRAVFSIFGKTHDDIQRYFSNLINIKENAVVICKDYYELPGYTEMEELFKQEKEKENVE